MLQGRIYNEPQAVVFDLDNTLTHRDLSISGFAEMFLAHYGARLSEPDYQTLLAMLLHTDNGGYGQPDNPYGSIKRSIAHRLHHDLHWKSSPPDEAELFDFWFKRFPACSVPMPGMHELLNLLKQQGVTMAILSNGNDQSRQATVDALGIREYVTGVFSSDGLGVKKPEPACFAKVISQTGLEPEACLMVGDHPTVDILGAQAVGMSAVWLQGFHEWPETMPLPPRITSLVDLLPLFISHEKTETSAPASATARQG